MRIRRICTAQPADPASYGEKAAPQAQVRRSALGTVKVVLKTPRGEREHAVGAHVAKGHCLHAHRFWFVVYRVVVAGPVQLIAVTALVATA